MSTSKVCAYCFGTIPAPESGSITTGYGRDQFDNMVCYDCCANNDRDYMRQHGKITLYLSGVAPTIRTGYSINENWRISNWPGSLRFYPIGNRVKVGAHNWGVDRYDTWFNFEGYVWHGVSIGNNTELLHCKRTATRSRNNPAPKRHYIGHAGLSGYMPNYTTVGETRGSVADDLGSLHELSQRKIKQLRRDWYISLDIYEHGNEYAEIVECDCGRDFETCANELYELSGM